MLPSPTLKLKIIINKQTSPIPVTQVREPPDVTQPNSVPDAGQHEVQLLVPCLTPFSLVIRRNVRLEYMKKLLYVLVLRKQMERSQLLEEK